MWASDGGYTDIVKVLLEAKADPNNTDKVREFCQVPTYVAI